MDRALVQKLNLASTNLSPAMTLAKPSLLSLNRVSLGNFFLAKEPLQLMGQLIQNITLARDPCQLMSLCNWIITLAKDLLQLMGLLNQSITLVK